MDGGAAVNYAFKVLLTVSYILIGLAFLPVKLVLILFGYFLRCVFDSFMIGWTV